jgi:hypothetical protein
MDWKWWTKVSGIILFVIAISNFYLAHYHNEGAVLSVENFPGQFDLDTLDVNENITFSFFLYNIGDTTAFIESISSNTVYGGTSSLDDKISVDPNSDFTLIEGSSQEVSVTLPAPGESHDGEITITIYYGENTLSTETVPVSWGSIL